MAGFARRLRFALPQASAWLAGVLAVVGMTATTVAVAGTVASTADSDAIAVLGHVSTRLEQHTARSDVLETEAHRVARAESGLTYGYDGLRTKAAAVANPRPDMSVELGEQLDGGLRDPVEEGYDDVDNPASASARSGGYRLAPRATRGGVGPVRVGQAGENAVRGAYDIGPKITVNVGGRTRILDGLKRYGSHRGEERLGPLVHPAD